MLAVLVSTYRPKQRLRKPDKNLVKRIKSFQQGYDGSIARCYFCKNLGKCDTDLQLHHLDYIESHNLLENLEPCHQTCNNSDHGKRNISDPSVGLRECERASASNPSAAENERTLISDEAEKWTSKEGAKHDIQRPGWSKWLRDLEKGPFASPSGRPVKLYKSTLSELAPWGIAKMYGLEDAIGSSVTYRRFIVEDWRGGILGSEFDEFGKVVYFLKYKPPTEK